jgi:hypothetical protein
MRVHVLSFKGLCGTYLGCAASPATKYIGKLIEYLKVLDKGCYFVVPYVLRISKKGGIAKW